MRPASKQVPCQTYGIGPVERLGTDFGKKNTTIILPQSPPFLGNFCKGVKIIHFSSETILGNF